jgi:hypothetical protein
MKVTFAPGDRVVLTQFQPSENIEQRRPGRLEPYTVGLVIAHSGPKVELDNGRCAVLLRVLWDDGSISPCWSELLQRLE